MEIINNFTLAGINFKVVYEDLINEGEDFGQFNPITSTIQIANYVLDEKDQKIEVPEDNKENTFYRELFHCFNYYYNNDMPEALAQTFANFMCEFKHTKQ